MVAAGNRTFKCKLMKPRTSSRRAIFSPTSLIFRSGHSSRPLAVWDGICPKGPRFARPGNIAACRTQADVVLNAFRFFLTRRQSPAYYQI